MTISISSSSSSSTTNHAIIQLGGSGHEKDYVVQSPITPVYTNPSLQEYRNPIDVYTPLAQQLQLAPLLHNSFVNIGNDNHNNHQHSGDNNQIEPNPHNVFIVNPVDRKPPESNPNTNNTNNNNKQPQNEWTHVTAQLFNPFYSTPNPLSSPPDNTTLNQLAHFNINQPYTDLHTRVYPPANKLLFEDGDQDDESHFYFHADNHHDDDNDDDYDEDDFDHGPWDDWYDDEFDDEFDDEYDDDDF